METGRAFGFRQADFHIGQGVCIVAGNLDDMTFRQMEMIQNAGIIYFTQIGKIFDVPFDIFDAVLNLFQFLIGFLPFFFQGRQKTGNSPFFDDLADIGQMQA